MTKLKIIYILLIIIIALLKLFKIYMNYNFFLLIKSTYNLNKF